MFTLHADGGILCLICCKHPAVTTSRGKNGNIYNTDPARPPRPNHLDNHLSSDQHQKGLEKTLNAFHYFPAIHQDRISDKVNSVAERVELIFWVLKEERIEK